MSLRAVVTSKERVSQRKNAVKGNFSNSTQFTLNSTQFTFSRYFSTEKDAGHRPASFSRPSSLVLRYLGRRVWRERHALRARCHASTDACIPSHLFTAQGCARPRLRCAHLRAVPTSTSMGRRDAQDRGCGVRICAPHAKVVQVHKTTVLRHPLAVRKTPCFVSSCGRTLR